jgi:hypothetical protein
MGKTTSKKVRKEGQNTVEKGIHEGEGPKREGIMGETTRKKV